MSDTEIEQLAAGMGECFKEIHPRNYDEVAMTFITWFKVRSEYALESLRDKFNSRRPENEKDLCLIILEVTNEYEQRLIQGLEQ